MASQFCKQRTATARPPRRLLGIEGRVIEVDPRTIVVRFKKEDGELIEHRFRSPVHGDLTGSASHAVIVSA